MGAHKKDYSNWQLTVLVLLRVTIGWHFLYEGLAKLFTPGWSAAEYLDVSRWIFGGLFQWMAANETILSGVNFLNIWGLILIGLGLMFGLFTRIASFGGMALLLLYYVANPPFVGLDFGPPTEGHYLIVNKNLVELFALFVIILFPTSHLIGIDRLFKRLQSEQPVKEIKSEDKGKPVPAEASDINRRNLLKSFATIPFAGAFLVSLIQKNKWESWEEQNLVDAVTSASVKTFDFASLKDLKGQIPTAKIKDVEISRLIMGGNLLSAAEGAYDLGYEEGLMKNIKRAIEYGAISCYIQGETTDYYREQGKLDLIAKAIDYIRSQGLIAGLGAHRIESIKACVDFGMDPDFWMKTLHHHNYWSADHNTWHDNMYCFNPDETVSYIKTLKQPVIAFKTFCL